MTAGEALRLDAFIARANAAYYGTRDPFADFTTAPEISQVFGELIGAWAAVTWEALGRPAEVKLVELGPGRGTLIADALRLIRATAPDFAAALRLHLVEFSPRLTERLAASFPEARLHVALDEVPPGPAVVIANEFLDALPIRQFVRRGGGFTERFVLDGRFLERPATAAPAVPATLLAEVAEGDVVERCEAAEHVADLLASRIASSRSAALIIDYGGELPFGDSLQALRAARPSDPLATPGEADLTAHVDFASLRAVAARPGVAVHGPVPQGRLLTRLGLYQRARALAAADPGIVEASARLAQPERMGLLFKALALLPDDLPPPSGFEPAPAPA